MTKIIIQAANGLHARPLAQFVKEAASYPGEITLSKGAKVASAKSMMKLLGLGVKQGDEVTLHVDGCDATEEKLAKILEEMQ